MLLQVTTGVVLMTDLEQRKNTLQSWQNLEVEIRDLQDLIAQFSNIVVGVRTYIITVYFTLWHSFIRKH